MSAYGPPQLDIPFLEARSRRVKAAWIDVVILAVIAIVISFITGNSHAGSWTTQDPVFGEVHHSGFQLNIAGAGAVIAACVDLAYSFLVEAFWGGRTLGKAMMGVRVVTQTGETPGVGAILLRTLLRIVDVLPFFYLLGYIVMQNSGRPARRVGDMVAGTTVTLIKPLANYGPPPGQYGAYPPPPPPYPPYPGMPAAPYAGTPPPPPYPGTPPPNWPPAGS